MQKILYSTVALLALIFISTQPAFAQITQPLVPQQNNQQQEVPPPSNQSDASLNWSGYVAKQSGQSYTSVTGTWTVPSVTAAASPSAGQADAMWVGIGGVSSRDLIQAGTQAIVENGDITYSAWIETLPNFSKTVALTVHSGDSVTATITEESEGQWLVTIANNTTGKEYSQTVAYNSSKSSAEWIEEMVTNGNGTFRPLDNFGSIAVTNASATANGQAEDLATLNAQPLEMVNTSQLVLASASALQNNSGFTVTRGTAVPTAARSTYSRHRHVTYYYTTGTTSTDSNSGYSVQTIPIGPFTITLYGF